MENETQYELALNEAINAAAAVGDFIIKRPFQLIYDLQHKLGSELVKPANLGSDKIIRERLGSKFPQYRFLSEEEAIDDQFGYSDTIWIIDPIDGTANYVRGHREVTTSIALVVDGEPVVAVVHAPFLEETYAAIRGRGATRNGQPIRVSETTELCRALIGAGLPRDNSETSYAIERVRRLAIECLDTRRSGSPTLDITSVATGQLDGYYESIFPWDIAAAGLIAMEAGAICGNLKMGAMCPLTVLQGGDYIVTTPGIFEQLYNLLRACV
jgi:myo-inositol-1(or 4)-monophosphatase